MNKLLRKYWYIKPILITLAFGIGLSKAQAQSSFFYECEAYFARDVFEDSKGCIIANLEDRLIRLSPQGTLLWEIDDNTLNHGIDFEDSQRYVFSSFPTESGGFGFAVFNYRSQKLWSNYDYNSLPEVKVMLTMLHDTARKLFVVAGLKKNIGVNTKEYYWIAGVDYRGKILWENIWRDENKNVWYKKILKNTLTKGYFLLTESWQSSAIELINVDTLGKVLNRNPIEPNPCILDSSPDYVLLDITLFNDTNYLATVIARTSCPDSDGSYFYIYNSKGKLLKRLQNDWAGGSLIQTDEKEIITYGGNLIAKFNKKLELEWVKEIFSDKDDEHMAIKKVAQSRDGGFYGIADGYRLNPHAIHDDYIVYVFKTDSLGQINQKTEYSEKLQPVMLQPNPASNKVRIAIPHYFGNVSVRFYNMHGVFLFEKTKNEQDMYDISNLSAGMYMVKARIEETGETRTMKLMVH